jgi:hypothetical protein
MIPPWESTLQALVNHAESA